MTPFSTFPDYACSGGVRYEAWGDRMKKTIGARQLPWGLPKPPALPTVAAGSGGNMEAGDYQVHMVGVTATGRKGLPFSTSPQTVTVSASGKIAVSAIPIFGSPEIVYVAFYRTTKDALSPFYYAGRVANGTATCDLNGADESLDVDDVLEPPAALADDEGAYAGPFAYEAPPAKSRCFAFDGRLWVYGEKELDPGPVSATSSSTTMEFPGGGLTSGHVGKSIVLDGEEVGYNITAVLSPNMLTVETAYVRPHWRGADPVGVSCRIMGDPFGLRYSDPDEPEYFPWCNDLPVGRDGGGTLRAHAEFSGEALLFTEDAIYAVYPTGMTAAPYAHRKTHSPYGCTAPRSVAAGRGGVYFFTGDHFARYGNGTATLIDEALGDWLDRLGAEMRPWIKAVRFGDRIGFGVATDGATVLNEIWWWDERLGAWDLPWTGLSFVDLEVIVTYEGRTQLWIETTAGTGYAIQRFDPEETADGPYVDGTATGATMDTLVDDVAAAWDESAAPGVIGQMLRITAGIGLDQERRVTAASATTLTVDHPWTVIPEAGSAYSLGAIDAGVTTGRQTLGRPHDEKQFITVEIGLLGNSDE